MGPEILGGRNCFQKQCCPCRFDLLLVYTFALRDGGNMIVFGLFLLGGGGGPIIGTDPLLQRDSQVHMHHLYIQGHMAKKIQTRISWKYAGKIQ